MTAIVCAAQGCSELLPIGRRRYCSDRCRNRMNRRAYRARKRGVDVDKFGKPYAAPVVPVKAANVPRVMPAESEDGRGSMRRGDGYERFVEAGGPAMVDAGATHNEVAERFGVSRVTITHWLAAYRQDLMIERKRVNWRPPAAALEALDDPVKFRERYFRDRYGNPYITADCHRRWMAALDRTIATGRQLAIVAPPRHGKTEALIHECIRQIIRNPNICIAWIGVNEDRAEDAVGLVLHELESNEQLIADFCGPGGSFKPPTRSGARWTVGEFTVATRTRAVKSATMKAFGRGGRIIGFDADVIVCDDLEDNRAVEQPHQREKTRNWFNLDVASRKVEHTGWLYIGSRQHPEDLIASLQENPEWEVIVEQAHSDDCVLPERPYEAHVDCVLAPELRSFRFLMQQKATISAPRFEMNFLNRPRADGMVMFEREVVEGCRDRSRVLGDVPPNTRLIAGLDPSGSSSSGYQAAILWAVHVESNTRYLVDLENERHGGVVHLRSILERWSLKYPGLSEWVIEENIVRDTLEHDEPLRKLKARLNFRFIPHITGRNKWDVRMGVPGMVPHFENKRIVLPYGNDESRGRVEQYINQLVNFTDQVTSHKTSWKTDLVMAGWLPEKTIQSWQHQFLQVMKVDYAREGLTEWRTEVSGWSA